MQQASSKNAPLVAGVQSLTKQSRYGWKADDPFAHERWQHSDAQLCTRLDRRCASMGEGTLGRKRQSQSALRGRGPRDTHDRYHASRSTERTIYFYLHPPPNLACGQASIRVLRQLAKNGYCSGKDSGQSIKHYGQLFTLCFFLLAQVMGGADGVRE